MKNIMIILFSTVLLFFNCGKPTESKSKKYQSDLQSPSVKTLNLKSNKSTATKTCISQTSPIKITEATLSKNLYSDHKDIRVTFKNTGKKSIKAIKFEWFCKNSFDEPANGRYFYGEGRFIQKSTHLLKHKQTKSEFWEDFSTDADKIIEIRAYYIVFADGTKWILNEELNREVFKKSEKEF